MSKPTLLVTCRAGNEDWCVEEIGNVLFEHDPEVEIVKTKYPGLIIVYSKIDPSRAYSIASSREYGFVVHVIPVMEVVELGGDIEKAVKNIVEEGERVKVRVRVRGRRGYSSLIWKRVVNALKSKNASHDPTSNKCLYVEGVNDKIYVGKAKC